MGEDREERTVGKWDPLKLIVALASFLRMKGSTENASSQCEGEGKVDWQQVQENHKSHNRVLYIWRHRLGLEKVPFGDFA